MPTPPPVLIIAAAPRRTANPPSLTGIQYSFGLRGTAPGTTPAGNTMPSSTETRLRSRYCLRRALVGSFLSSSEPSHTNWTTGRRRGSPGVGKVVSLRHKIQGTRR